MGLPVGKQTRQSPTQLRWKRRLIITRTGERRLLLNGGESEDITIMTERVRYGTVSESLVAWNQMNYKTVYAFYRWGNLPSIFKFGKTTDCFWLSLQVWQLQEFGTKPGTYIQTETQKRISSVHNWRLHVYRKAKGEVIISPLRFFLKKRHYQCVFRFYVHLFRERAVKPYYK